ncbi:MAG: hypothetical protein K0S60_927 [Evtepia sp.]|jgi:hypothetical protein|nr:hypothetical protein [Evtepia sp.]
MVRVIMGAKGTGKTKQLIELINYAADNEIGNVICIESGSKLTFDISNCVRLIDSSNFATNNFTFLKGFISGLYASNYDITHVFIDSLCTVVPSDPASAELEDFLKWLNGFAERNNIKFTITISADSSLATDTMKTYF